MSAPERIWATVNGASTRLPDGSRQLIGGWSEDKDRPRAVEYVRADLFRRQSPAGVDEKWLQHLSARIVVDVCELDRDSPEDDPTACIVYAPELTHIVERRVIEALSSLSVKEPEGVASHEPAPGDTQAPLPSIGETQEPEGAEPVAWFIPPDADGVYQQVSPQHYGDPDLVPLYASPPPKDETITDEVVERVAKAISPHLWNELTHEQRMSDDYAWSNRLDAQTRALRQARATLSAALSSEAHNG